MKTKTRIKHYLGRYPSLFKPCYRILASRHAVRECLISDRTELVIEGFPRSANTYAVVAFRMAQPQNYEIAHHLHVEAQVLEGVRRGLPTLVLIRSPRDAIRSLLARHSDLDQSWVLRRYINFYSSVLSVRASVVVSDFDETIANFGHVVERINRRYQMAYGIPQIDESYRDRVFGEIDRINRELDSGLETHVARPVSGRADHIELMSSGGWSEADDIYFELVGAAC